MHNQRDPLGFIPKADAEYMRDRVPPPDEPSNQPAEPERPRISRDGAHTAILGVALALMGVGAGAAFGWPYAFLLIGALLLAGLVYARVFAGTG